MTSRMEEGLPIVASIYLNFIIWGILARAKEQFDIKVCHFIFLFNHMHLLLVVRNPEHVEKFQGFIKAEITHAINHILGYRKKSRWDKGADTPIVLDKEKAINQIVYIYSNPQRANLVDSIDEYPGVSSWKMFVSGVHKKTCKKVHRPQIKPIQGGELSVNEGRRLAEELDRCIKEEKEFVLEPFAWLEGYEDLSEKEKAEIKEEIISRVRDREEEFRKERVANKRTVIGSTALRRQSMCKDYYPKSFGKRMICLGTQKEDRIAFISMYRNLCGLARKAYEQWVAGHLRVQLPAGMIPPRMLVLAGTMVSLL